MAARIKDNGWKGNPDKNNKRGGTWGPKNRIPGRFTTYSYDAAGNRTSQGGTYSASGNHAVTFGAYHLTYDNDGELTQKHDTVTRNIFNYSWSADGRLLKVQHTLGSSSDSVEFAYNALGQLARRKTNGTNRLDPPA